MFLNPRLMTRGDLLSKTHIKDTLRTYINMMVDNMVDEVVDDTKNVVVPQEKYPSRIGSSKGIKPGRPKGSKNKSTLLREALNEDFDAALAKDFKKVIKVVVKQATKGCRQSQKMLLDRIVPTIHAESDKDKGNKFSGGIHISIGSLEDSKAVHISEDICDVEYEVINEEDST